MSSVILGKRPRDEDDAKVFICGMCKFIKPKTEKCYSCWSCDLPYCIDCMDALATEKSLQYEQVECSYCSHSWKCDREKFLGLMLANPRVRAKITGILLKREKESLDATAEVVNLLNTEAVYTIDRNSYNLMRTIGTLNFDLIKYEDHELKVIPIIKSMSEFMDDIQTKFIARFSGTLESINFYDRFTLIKRHLKNSNFKSIIVKRFVQHDKLIQFATLWLQLVRDYALMIKRIKDNVSLDESITIKNPELFLEELHETMIRIRSLKPRKITRGIEVPVKDISMLNYVFSTRSIPYF